MKFYSCKNLPVFNEILQQNDVKIVKISSSQLKNDKEFQVLVKTGDYVKKGQPILQNKDNQKILASVSGKILSVNTEHDVFENLVQTITIESDLKNDEFAYEKMQIKSTQNLVDLCLYFGLSNARFYLADFFNSVDNQTLNIDVTYNNYNFINKIIFLKFKNQIEQTYSFLIELLNIKKVVVFCNKKDVKKIKKCVKIKQDNLVYNIQTKIKDNCLNLLDIFNIYNALNNIPQTDSYVYFSGDSVYKNALIKLPLGASINDGLNLIGGFKCDIEEVENFKYTALLAYNDEIALKNKIKQCKNKIDKEKLKKLLKEKKLEAEEKVYKNLNVYHQKYLDCLSACLVNNIYEYMFTKNFESYITKEIFAINFLSKKEFH